MSKPKFKVGDRVKRINNTNHGSNIVFNVYDIGEIVSISEEKIFDTNYYNVKMDKNRLINKGNAEYNLELVQEIKHEIVENLNAGTKNDSSKPDLSLIPTDALWGMAAALTYGAKKYSRHNYRLGISYSRLVAAAMRHISQFNEGQEADNESGLSHIDHAMASLAMLKFMIENKPEMDDRWVKPEVKKESITIPAGTEIVTLDDMKKIQNRGR